MLLRTSEGRYPSRVAKDDPRPSGELSLDSSSSAHRDNVISATPYGHVLLHDAGALDSADFSIPKRLVGSKPEADPARCDL
jgi:hypothetical protein